MAISWVCEVNWVWDNFTLKVSFEEYDHRLFWRKYKMIHEHTLQKKIVIEALDV